MTITDSFGRAHDYLRISLTERCNLHCFYCMPEEGIRLRPRSQFMTNEEITSIAKVFVSLGIKKIRLTGGEPLIRNGVENILTELAKLRVELAVTTNGILIDKFVDRFKILGIKSINVSLDSLRREKFNAITRRELFDVVFANINTLLNENFHVKVNMVALKGVNDDEVEDFIQWTNDKNIHVRFIEFMPFKGNRWDWSKGVSSAELLSRIRVRFGNNIVRISDRENDTSKNFSIRGYKGTFAIISAVTEPFCTACNRLRLTADGHLKNCLFSESETDLLSAMRKGQDIIPLIMDVVKSKKAVRGRMAPLEGFGKITKRAMVAIGG